MNKTGWLNNPKSPTDPCFGKNRGRNYHQDQLPGSLNSGAGTTGVSISWKAQKHKAQSVTHALAPTVSSFFSLPPPLMFPWMDASFLRGHPGTRPSHSPKAKRGIQSVFPPNERTRWYRAPPRAAEKKRAVHLMPSYTRLLAVGLAHGAKTCPQKFLWQRARGWEDAVSKLADALQSCQPEAK